MVNGLQTPNNPLEQVQLSFAIRKAYKTNSLHVTSTLNYSIDRTHSGNTTNRSVFSAATPAISVIDASNCTLSVFNRP